MKNLQVLLCLITGFVVSAASFAQDNSKKHSIGLQLNPYLDIRLYEGNFFKPVFAGRYGFNLNNHLSFGPEVSGYFIIRNQEQSDLNISNLNFGGFVRYSFLPASRIRPLFELSPYYTSYHFKSKSIQTQEGIGKEYDKSYFGGYLSPGVTLYSKNHKFSVDLMYKFSNKPFVNDHKSSFTYRLNFNF